MLLFYSIDELLGTQGAKYTSAEKSGGELMISMELPRKEHACPSCGCMTDRIHDYRKQKINAGKFNHLHVTVVYRKRRYVCPECGKKFIESNDFVGRYQRMTKAVIANVINSLREEVSFKHVAIENRLSIQTVMRLFDQLSFGRPQTLPEAIGIDEFRGNANRVKYQVILTDLVSGNVFDILPNRYESHISKYFRQFSREERDKVKTYVSDMYREYDRIGSDLFHNADRIIDRYHWVRQVIWALENVRKREQKRLGKQRQKYFKRSRSLLIKRFNELTADNQQAVLRMLELSSDLSTAHYYKEKVLSIRDIDDPNERRKAFHTATDSMKNSGIDELEKCADTYYNWSPGIINSLDSAYSNGLTEGCNNKIKVMKRIGYGYRNYDRFRKRILHCFS